MLRHAHARHMLALLGAAALASGICGRAPAALNRAPCYACWDRVAACESGGRWNYNGGSGFDGGLQFLPSTWRAMGGTRYAPYAHQATRLQQIAVASTMSLSNWPVCGRRYYG